MRKKKSLAWLTILAGAALSLCLSTPLAAQDSQDSKTFEKGLETGLKDVINRGATIFNKQGDYAGCYRLYEAPCERSNRFCPTIPRCKRRLTLA